MYVRVCVRHLVRDIYLYLGSMDHSTGVYSLSGRAMPASHICSVVVPDRCMSLACGREQASIMAVINVMKSILITLCVCMVWNGMECLSAG